VNVQPGTWTLVVEFVDPAGNETSDPYTGSIALQSGASVTGLPHGSIKDGTFTIHVKNTTAATQDFFLDPRLGASPKVYTLSSQTSNTTRVPMSGQALPPLWLVPTESNSLAVTTPKAAAHPFTFDLGPLLGDPDVPSYQPGAVNGSTNPSVTVAPGVAQGPLTPGFWSAVPAPAAGDGFRTADASHENVTLKATVTTAPFDLNFTSATDDLWYGSVHLATLQTFTPVILKPGATASIRITLTGIGPVSGTLYVDSALIIQYPAGFFPQFGGSELAAIPYSYTGS